MLALNRLDRHDRTALVAQIAGGRALPDPDSGTNFMEAQRPQQPRPLVELGPRGHYRLPPLAQIRGAAFPPGEVLP
jgi:hypothetical protein